MPRPRRPLPEDASFTAREIHRRMLDLGFSQKSLAARADVNSTYIRDIFLGRSQNPKTEQLQKVATALGCFVTDLTDPGWAGANEPTSEAPDHPSELAIIEMWRVLSPFGRDKAIRQVAGLLREETAAARSTPTVSRPRRKRKNV